MPWGFGKKRPSDPSDPALRAEGPEPEGGSSTVFSPGTETTPLPSEVRFRIEAVVQFRGLYSVVGQTEQGTLRLPTVLKRLRVTPTPESGAPIRVTSAMAHHKTIHEVPTGLKVGLTLAYEYDRGRGLFPNATPNLYGLEKGDVLVAA